MTAVQWMYVTYGFAAVGALGLFLALPRGAARSRTAPALLFGAVSMGGLLAVLRYGLGEAGANNVYFYILALLAVGGAARVITHPRPVYSALYFVLVVLATAGLILMTGAEFLAAALVIVYAGAILVTYVFVIMLAQQSSDEPDRPSMHYDAESREPAAAVLAGFLLVATLAGAIVSRPWKAAEAGPPGADNIESLGRELLTRYAVSVELAGVLLMVAMIGALAIANKRVPGTEAGRAAQPPLGLVGRTAPPF